MIRYVFVLLSVVASIFMVVGLVAVFPALRHFAFFVTLAVTWAGIALAEWCAEARL